MKGKIIKKLILLLAIISMLGCNVCYIYAENNELIEKITETEDDYAEDTVYSMLRGNNLNYGTTQATKVSSHEINVYGLTQCLISSVYFSLQ